MENEEKILSLLETLNATMNTMQNDMKEFKQETNLRFDDLQEDIAEIRSASNTILEWTERVEKVINVPLQIN